MQDQQAPSTKFPPHASEEQLQSLHAILQLCPDDTWRREIMSVVSVGFFSGNQSMPSSSSVTEAQVDAQDQVWVNAGSGFILSSGEIVTNLHVVYEIFKMNKPVFFLAMDGRFYQTDEIMVYSTSGTKNPLKDIALLNLHPKYPLEVTVRGYYHLAKEAPKLGDELHTLSFPLRLSRFSPTLTKCVLSGVDERLLWTLSGCFNKASAGAPVLSERGEVTGMLVQTSTAFPFELRKDVTTLAKWHGSAALGIVDQKNREDINEEFTSRSMSNILEQLYAYEQAQFMFAIPLEGLTDFFSRAQAQAKELRVKRRRDYMSDHPEMVSEDAARPPVITPHPPVNIPLRHSNADLQRRNEALAERVGALQAQLGVQQAKAPTANSP
jgi:hypothetical protein